jgi:serine/threonine-protein kinase RsbW
MEAAGNVELILAEALNNIVEHGYPDPQSGGPISVFCEHKDECLQIKLVDKGVPMPNGQMPIGLAVETDVDFFDLPEGGFGWFIIKDLAKEVVYRRIDDANHLDLQIEINEHKTN